MLGQVHGASVAGDKQAPRLLFCRWRSAWPLPEHRLTASAGAPLVVVPDAGCRLPAASFPPYIHQSATHSRLPLASPRPCQPTCSSAHPSPLHAPCLPVQEFQRQTGLDLRGNARALRRLRTECERAKIALSSRLTADLALDGLFEGEWGRCGGRHALLAGCGGCLAAGRGGSRAARLFSPPGAAARPPVLPPCSRSCHPRPCPDLPWPLPAA